MSGAQSTLHKRAYVYPNRQSARELPMVNASMGEGGLVLNALKCQIQFSLISLVLPDCGLQMCNTFNGQMSARKGVRSGYTPLHSWQARHTSSRCPATPWPFGEGSWACITPGYYRKKITRQKEFPQRLGT